MWMCREYTVYIYNLGACLQLSEWLMKCLLKLKWYLTSDIFWKYFRHSNWLLTIDIWGHSEEALSYA